MGVFNLEEKEGFGPSVQVTFPSNITKKQLQEFVPFRDWKTTLRQNLQLQRDEDDHAHHREPYELRSVEVQSVDWFGPKTIGFVKISAKIKNQNPDKEDLPGIALLRGGSVAVLMVLRPQDAKDERYVILTEQPRIPAGSLRFLEIPAGMLDGSNDFIGKTAKEIQEETMIKVRREDLINMTELALQESQVKDTLQTAMYPSPGGSDEFIPIYLWEKELDRQRIEELRGKLTGQRTQGEMITLRVCDYEDLWREGARDAKTLAAWALYEGLSRAGILQDALEQKRRTSGSNSPDGHPQRQKTL
ncbi:ADP-sugar diphosphatase [Ascochyta rabiei]|uniref:Hydrolase n=1 Tax=Didymella rabiei TaxID=5454 RepID=A0A163CDC5_DIDRA|nr:ADP-sugar diphosphatase [Ascochyta rabiei]KZM22382.1 hydrolase [Ascochyta rabiei]UPX17368.1 ADP-sugar diphosphatase [Ascochyta rabiei]